MDKLEEDIFNQLQEKDAEGNLTANAKALLDTLQTPCTCVLTFESEEGVQRAKAYNEAIDWMNSRNPNVEMAKYENFLGVKNGLKIRYVTEPTDIIWENR